MQNGPSAPFAELVAAPSSFELARDGIHAVTRDYMHACLWDVRSSKEPLSIFHVHEQLRDRLMDVYDNEAIFDRLGCSISPTGKHVVAGTYGEVAVFSAASPQYSTLRTCVSPTAINVRPFPAARRPLSPTAFVCASGVCGTAHRSTSGYRSV